MPKDIDGNPLFAHGFVDGIEFKATPDRMLACYGKVTQQQRNEARNAAYNIYRRESTLVR
jgi:hypothetical protein